MVHRNVWFRGRFSEGQIPLRGASDAQTTRVVVGDQFSHAPSHVLSQLLCWSFSAGQTELMEKFLICTRSSGISTWLVVWNDKYGVSFVGL